MRSANTLTSRTPAPANRTKEVATPPLSLVPTIRLTTATPSAADSPSAYGPSTATILAPKPQADTRKRLVPKKSKLSLLVGSKRGEKGKDLSDVARRVGMPSASTGRSFDIYVDPADDPDIGEIVVLKKKKSRAGLDDLRWGELNGVTNAGTGTEVETVMTKPVPEPALLRTKNNDEKEKWWTIGRGRKDSKEKTKEKSRVKTDAKENLKENMRQDIRRPFGTRRSTPPEQTKSADTRQRSQSFDTGIALDTTAPFPNFISVPLPDEQDFPRRTHVRTNTSPSFFGPRSGTPIGDTALAQSSESNDSQQNGSIALRAMRSVRSLARIGSWAQLKSMPAETVEVDIEGTKVEKKKKERTRSMRLSKSSFEMLKNGFNTVRRSTDLTGTVRTVSSQATAVSGTAGRNSRRQSGSSAASSVKTTHSDGSVIEPIIRREPQRASASSIRWIDQVETVKDKRSPGSMSTFSEGKNHQGSKRTAEGRRRPGLASLFSISGFSGATVEQGRPWQDCQGPVLSESNLVTASPGHDSETSATLLELSLMESEETPVKRARPRPLSEQLIGRSRPAGIIGDEDGVIQILDAVTTDLASLVNRLDLEVTPNATPRRMASGSAPSTRVRLDNTLDGSPVKSTFKTLLNEKSDSSLRSYAQHLRNASSTMDFPGQQISPWPTSNTQLEVAHDLDFTVERGDFLPAFRLKQGRVCHPPALPPAPFEPAPVFHPLPASRVSSRLDLRDSPTRALARAQLPDFASYIASSSTFGERLPRYTNDQATLQREKGNLSRGSRGSSYNPFDLETPNDNVFMNSTTRLALGMRGTMGSVNSATDVFDFEDPDCDIPGELQLLLRKNFDRDSVNSSCSDTASDFGRSPSMYPLPPSPGTPPCMPLPPVRAGSSKIPVFHAPSVDDEIIDLEVDDGLYPSDDETKKSFDFTAELRKLSESGGSDRQSFVMQLEDAFKTPAKYGNHGLGAKLDFGSRDDVPEVPPIPMEYRPSVKPVRNVFTQLSASPARSEPASEKSFVSDGSIISEAMDLESLHGEDLCVKQPSQLAHTMLPIPSRGHLNMNFRFGGGHSPVKRPSMGSSDDLSALSDDDLVSPHYTPNQPSFSVDFSEKPLTLSDIIPPPSHHSRNQSFSSVAEAESSVLRSIFTKAPDLSELLSPDTSARIGSDSDSKGDARLDALAQLTTHSRQNSEVSFSGLSSYSEIRRGFEYGSSRPAFYPAPQAPQNSLRVPDPQWRESIFSLASVSSYGRVLRPGSNDPFDYGVPVCARPISEDISFTVDDTFAFMRHGLGRQRVDSDASNYSFHGQAQNASNVHQRRNRRQIDSMISVTSGPPVSLYNRGFSYYGHRRGESNGSNNLHNAFGANGEPVSGHRRDSSADSVTSDFSVQRLGRPDVGDKMFASAHDYRAPLSSISASPSQIESSRYQTTFDSIMDEDQDSLLDETGRRSSESESIFGHDFGRPAFQDGGLQPPIRFRPLSTYSINDGHSPKREDDTLISMLGGGHVRRRSIGSTFEGSPCVRAEKRRHRGYSGRVLARIPSGDDYDYLAQESPNKACSTKEQHRGSMYDVRLDGSRMSPFRKYKSPYRTARDSGCDYQFGGNRMSLARKGLLERQSLEDCCLSADGEDISTSRKSLGVFRRPNPISRSRSGSGGQGNLGADTPPLSISDTSSQSSSSHCSLDLARLGTLLNSSSKQQSNTESARARPRDIGLCRRNSGARASRASMYETIEEEVSAAAEAFPSTEGRLTSPDDACAIGQAYSVPVPDIKIVQWDNEDAEPILRKYYALENEARQIVDASQRLWEDTPFSLYALQTFEPPRHPAGMQALLEHSLNTYGPLPSELRGCRRRTRTLSRPSPYPRVFTQPSVESRPPIVRNNQDTSSVVQKPNPLRDVTVDSNLNTEAQIAAPALNPLKPFTPFSVKFKEKGQTSSTTKTKTSHDLPTGGIRPRVPANMRKNVSGGAAKVNGGKSPRKAKENKENAAHGVARPAESLRIVRPRPRGRPTPAAPRPIRI
ncbi:hypothetical protein M0805_006712 [Coniferiporia weirii]|nr:hypothetical protein M0805_006712 [Coniferiporia weirii]